MSGGRLDDAIRDLQQAARDLRAQSIEPARAAELVDRCAELAADIGRELDQAARDSERDTPDTQERLL
ncbi:MAG: hypothetical protein GXY03_04360 [Solirubrobacterales bacterium]|nr:hypothetical protein [Solirubrobacterales bacterium]